MPSPQLRTAGRWLATGTLLTAIVVTQWPFQYRFTSYAIHRRWARIDWAWFHRIDRDFVLVPLGIGFGLWRRAGKARVVIESLALGTLTAVVLELAQLLTRDRYTSFLDVWHNAVGCVAGCVLAVLVDRGFRDRGLGAEP
jgi:glycopeptide antibiotics resistance protein